MRYLNLILKKDKYLVHLKYFSQKIVNIWDKIEKIFVTKNLTMPIRNEAEFKIMTANF